VVTVSEQWWVAVDRSTCLGSGVCAGTAPRHFSIDAGGRSQPRSERVDPDEAVLDAVLACPAQAITVTFERSSEMRGPG
jgi:ferredoxin